MYTKRVVHAPAKISIIRCWTCFTICRKTAHLLDFYTIVIDNREEFANKNIFTEAQEVHCVNYEEAEQYFPKKENTCYVIVTRGHKDDKVCLKKRHSIKKLFMLE